MLGTKILCYYFYETASRRRQVLISEARNHSFNNSFKPHDSLMNEASDHCFEELVIESLTYSSRSKTLKHSE